MARPKTDLSDRRSNALRGRDFEKLIEATYDIYESQGVAHLERLPVETVGKGKRIFVRRAPYDGWGYLLGPMGPHPSGTAIAVEIKSTHPQGWLPIVKPGRKGNGLHFHQLEALVRLHRADGLAYLVWANGNETGVLNGEGLAETYQRYRASFDYRDFRKRGLRRSIDWEELEAPGRMAGDLPNWLASFAS